MNFSLYYRKNNNEELFNALEKSDFKITHLQNYIPLYDNFFSLNATNYNSINLNQKYYLTSIVETTDSNSLVALVTDVSNTILEKSVFCKFSPLLDPLRLLTGKYDVSNNVLKQLPKFNDTPTTCFPKLLDKNNSAYVDSFFTYLSSQLLHNFNYINAIDYYGSYIGIKKKFNYNMVDDIDYLNECDFFHKNEDILYCIDNNQHANIFNIDSRSNKKKIVISEKNQYFVVDKLEDNKCFIGLTSNTDDTSQIDIDHVNIDLSNVCVYSTNLPTTTKSSKSDSSCSSKSSNTSAEYDESDSDCDSNSVNTKDNESNNDIDNNSDNDSDCNNCDSSVATDNSTICCSIYEFPVQMISMEKCTNTLDYLMENDLLNDEEWASCLFQIIITLTLFQKVFSFTHNDLHTNNIMYVNTDKQYIHYCFNNTYYKVPTFGKVYKIIDFGRSIYKFNGKTMCSDSFHPKGDAGTQYNCEPYFNDKKPRLEPNYSFDLCRLACCLFDNFIEDLDDLESVIKKNKVAQLVHSWLIDDKKRNILYKTNGEERYPEFKLYKMIARTIHGAVPSKQLDHVLFKKYIVPRKKINRNHNIINIDTIPILG